MKGYLAIRPFACCVTPKYTIPAVSTGERNGPGEDFAWFHPSERLSRAAIELPCDGIEDIGEVSREIRVPPPELERWRRMFLEGACEGLKTKNAPDGELMRTRAKLGEMTMRVELQAELLEKRGYGEELRKLLRRAGG